MENAITGLHCWIKREISESVLSGLAGEITTPRESNEKQRIGT